MPLRKIANRSSKMKMAMLVLSLPAATLATNSTERKLMMGDLPLSDIPCSLDVTYRIEVTDTWCRETHPFDFTQGIDGEFPPSAGAHTSPTVVIAHNDQYNLFHDGDIASDSLCTVATTGSPAGLSGDLDADVNVYGYSVGVPIASCGSETAVAAAQDGTTASQYLEITLSEGNSYISAVHMLAPSPDWFTAVREVNLCENGYWIQFGSGSEQPYDAGCDSGTDFIGEDIVTNPREGITEFEADDNVDVDGPFEQGNAVEPVAIFSATLLGVAEYE